MIHLAAITLGYILDFFIPDPEGFHFVRCMGVSIDFSRKKIEQMAGKNTLYLLLGGFCLVLLNLLLWLTLFGGLLLLTYGIHFFLGFLFECFFSFQIFAKASLRKACMKVYSPLLEGDLSKAREMLSFIVGRDTKELDREHIIKGDLETLAENFSDGVMAPWFYMVLFFGISLLLPKEGGWLGSCLPFLGGIGYKLVNTMDSMMGYKNERFFYLGKAAARLDDIANFIPARVSVVFLLGGACILRLLPGKRAVHIKNAIKIFLRDRYKSTSPNSGQTEAFLAGALGVTLLGDACYFGKLVRKKEIGDPLCEPGPYHIPLANSLITWGSVFPLLMLLGLLAGMLSYL